MDHMQLVINAMLYEQKKFTPNHYDFSIAAEKQLIISKMKSVKDRDFRAIKRLMEMTGKFFKIRENVYRDLRYPDTIIVMKAVQSKIKPEFFDKLKTDFPHSQMTILTLNTSNDITSITHDGYLITLCFGDTALDYLFGNSAGEIKARMKKSTDDYILSLTKELLSTFNEENERCQSELSN